VKRELIFFGFYAIISFPVIQKDIHAFENGLEAFGQFNLRHLILQKPSPSLKRHPLQIAYSFNRCLLQ
jgi:hypothetical protein